MRLSGIGWSVLWLVLTACAGCRREASWAQPPGVINASAAAPAMPSKPITGNGFLSPFPIPSPLTPVFDHPERVGWPEWKRRAAQYEPLMHAAAARHGVDARWLWIIAFLETRFRPEAVSPRQARGLMQFTPATAKSYGLTDPHQPAAAIDAAAQFLRRLALRFGGRFDLVLAAYNAGEGAVDAYLRGYTLRLPNGRVINPRRLQTGGLPPFPETCNYVRRGLALERFLTNKKHGSR